jgi:hypothetical protein
MDMDMLNCGYRGIRVEHLRRVLRQLMQTCTAAPHFGRLPSNGDVRRMSQEKGKKASPLEFVYLKICTLD